MNKTSYEHKLLHRLLCAGLILALALSIPVAVRAVAAEMISIGDITFSSSANENSKWSNGNGWKNLPGKYVAMVNYNGSKESISADGGTVTFAVAGVNRIGVLMGDCSYRFVGTGIVLVDRIAIEDGNTISLETDTSLYDKGSAAFFLKVGENTYELLNGDVPALLDETYELNGIELIVPGNSSLVLSTTTYLTETWVGKNGTETSVARYKDSIPWQDFEPKHDGGTVTAETITSKLTLGKNSTLTIKSGGSVKVERITTTVIQKGFKNTASTLITGGTVNVNGTLEGGFLEVKSGGSLKGSGTVQSSDITLNAGGSLSKDLLLEDCDLSVSDGMTISPKVKNSTVILNGSGITLSEVNVSGTSYVGTDRRKTSDIEYDNSFGTSSNVLGNVKSSDNGVLGIVCNEYPHEASFGEAANHLEDCCLTMNGTISGATVAVLAGYVGYTGAKTNSLPKATWSAGRVYFPGFDIDSTDFPLIMSKKDAEERLKDDTILVMRLVVCDEWINDRGKARQWRVDTYKDLPPVARDDTEYTCASFLEANGLTGDMSEYTYYTAVEVIYSDLSRVRHFMDDDMPFTTKDAILIRVLDCYTQGGQGGSSISHTETTYTGNGNLGGTGDGDVTGGNGKVIFGKQTETTEAETTTEKESTTEKVTTTEKATTTEKTTSTEKTTASTEKGTESGEDETETSEQDTRSGEDETESGEKKTTRTSRETTRHSYETTRQSYETTRQSYGTSEYGETRRSSDPTDESDDVIENGLTPVVVENGNGRYTLAVYEDGIETELPDGQIVHVIVPNPEWVTEDDVCYAVFENNGQDRWIHADYDSTAKELSFDADQTGTFGVARVSVQGVTYPAANADTPLYRSLSIRIGTDEITELSGPVKAEAAFTEGEYSGTGLYAVFVDEHEALHIFPITCDENDMKYRFEPDVTGSFAVVRLDTVFGAGSAMLDDAGPGSALYAACRSREEVRLLIAIRRLTAFWS